MKSRCLRVIQTIRTMETLCKFRAFLIEQHTVDILKSGNQIHRFTDFRMIIKMGQCGFYRRHTRTTADNQQIFIFKLLHRECISIRSTHEKCISCFQIKHSASQSSDLTNGKFHIPRSFSTDRDRCLSDFRQRQLEKLSVTRIFVTCYTNRKLRCRLAHNMYDFVWFRFHNIFHCSTPPLLYSFFQFPLQVRPPHQKMRFFSDISYHSARIRYTSAHRRQCHGFHPLQIDLQNHKICAEP